MTDPFQTAWGLLKALPEQQMGYASPTGRRGTSLGSWKRTMHPAIQGIMNRRSGRQVPQMDFRNEMFMTNKPATIHINDFQLMGISHLKKQMLLP